MAWLIKHKKLSITQSLDYMMSINKGTNPLPIKGFEWSNIKIVFMFKNEKKLLICEEALIDYSGHFHSWINAIKSINEDSG